MSRYNLFKSKLSILLFVTSLAFAGDAMASHFRGASISWVHVSGNTVDITIRSSWRTIGIGGRSFNLGDGALATATAGDLISTLTDSAGETYGFYETNVRHTYSSSGPWTIFLDSCCRIGTLVNAANNSYRVAGIVDLRSGQQGSTVVSFPPILQMNKGPNSVPLAVVDPDGTPSCRMATSSESRITGPLPTAGSQVLAISSSCVLSWDASLAILGQKYAAQIIMSEGGVNVPLDFVIEVADINSVPQCQLNGTINNSVPVGVPFSISVTATDPDGDPLNLNHLGLPAGATLTPVSGSTQASPFTATFDWTPPTLGTQSVTLLFTDPSNQQCQSSFSIDATNAAPTADNDAYGTNEDTPLNVAAPGVLDGDIDTDGDPLTALLDTTTSNGSLTLNADGSFNYNPVTNYCGSDSFTYHANDGIADSNVATVTITVTCVNDAPVAIANNYTHDEDTTLTGNVIADNTGEGLDFDVDGDALMLAATSSTLHGTITFDPDDLGGFSYEPFDDYCGPDEFGYSITEVSLQHKVRRYLPIVLRSPSQ